MAYFNYIYSTRSLSTMRHASIEESPSSPDFLNDVDTHYAKLKITRSVERKSRIGILVKQACCQKLNKKLTLFHKVNMVLISNVTRITYRVNADTRPITYKTTSNQSNVWLFMCSKLEISAGQKVVTVEDVRAVVLGSGINPNATRNPKIPLFATNSSWNYTDYSGKKLSKSSLWMLYSGVFRYHQRSLFDRSIPCPLCRPKRSQDNIWFNW